MKANTKKAEIQSRACQRIGEISQELQNAKQRDEHARYQVPNDDKTVTKEQQLADAGIYRYQELTGGHQEQAQQHSYAPLLLSQPHTLSPAKKPCPHILPGT